MLLLEQFEAFALEFQPRLLQFAAAQVHNGCGELSDGVEPGLIFVFRHDPKILQKMGVMGEEHDVQVVGGYAGIGQFPGVLGEDPGFVEEVVEGEPFFEPAGAPFGNILRLLPLYSERSATFWK